MHNDITNPDLLRAIRVLNISDNSKTRATYYNALMNSTLLLPLSEPVQQGGALQSGTEVALWRGETSEGEPYLLAFTDVDSLLRWHPEKMQYLALPAAELIPMLVASGAPMLMLNVSGTVGGEITSEELRILAEGGIPGTAQTVEKSEIRLYASDELTISRADSIETPDLRRAIRYILSVHADIRAAFLFYLSDDPVIGIEFDDDLDAEKTDHILRTIASSFPHDVIEEPVSLVELQGELLSAVQSIIGEPIYRRKND